jgi:hypothetical protein
MFCSNISFHNFHVIAMGLQHIIPHFMPLIKKYSWTDWIKKSAKYKNATLITLNIKHFPMKEIDIVRPY